MRPGIAAIAVLSCGLAALGAQAETCAEAQTQLEMNDCAGRALDVSEMALKDIVAAVEAALDPESVEALSVAQAAWRVWRDAQCAFETQGLAGGSLRPSVEALCRADLTDIQTARLAARLSCPEGDILCAGN